MESETELAFQLVNAGLTDWGGRLILPPDIFHLPSDDIWWRAELYLWDRQFQSKIVLIPFEVVKTTPRGVRLKDDDRTRFVRGDAIRQHALPTMELAVKDLRRRLIAHKRHLTRQLTSVTHMVDALGTTKEWLEYGCPTEDQQGEDPPAPPTTILGFVGDGNRVHRRQHHRAEDHVYQRALDQVAP